METIPNEELYKRREKLEREADALEDEAEGLRDEAHDLDNDADRKKAAIVEIEKELRRRGALYQPGDAAMWGEHIARAIEGTSDRIHMRSLDSDWASNGHIMWRTETIPDGFRKPSNPAGAITLGHEMTFGERRAIDLSHPVGSGEYGHTNRARSDFNVGSETVRYQDLYIQAIQASGNTVAVTMPTRLLVSYRDGVPMAAAMPIRIDAFD